MSDVDLYRELVEAKRTGRSVLLATVVRTAGSVPRHAGSKMLVDANGAILAGTVGGGEMENRVLERASEVIAGEQPEMLHYDLVDPADGDPGVCGGQMDIFMEPIMPDPTVLVIGCGHVGQALADLAKWVGFRVIVSDDRADLCSPENIPDADAYLVCAPAEIVEKATIHAQTYVASVTRGVPFDVAMLPMLLKTEAPYIGVMGSRRRWATTVQELKVQGIPEETLMRIHAPIGLELEAETPREIAVSIIAEIIARQKQGTGEAMKWPGAVQATDDSSPDDDRP
jgi:xanthine dehydrogenase accessory factor